MCLEIEVEPYMEHLDNLIDAIVLVVLIVVLHISASEQYYAGSALVYGIVLVAVVGLSGLCLILMTKSLKSHQLKHQQVKACNELRAKAHRTHKRLQAADQDGDGMLDRQEMAELFDKLDQNGDGMVSHKELMALVTQLDTARQKRSASLRSSQPGVDSATMPTGGAVDVGPMETTLDASVDTATIDEKETPQSKRCMAEVEAPESEPEAKAEVEAPESEPEAEAAG